MPPLFPVTLALYAVSCALYLAHLVGGSAPAANGLARGARIVLAIAFASHAVDIGWLCMHGFHPVVNVREALSFAAWLMCGAYLISSLRYKMPVVGALVVPVTLVLDVAARLTPGIEARNSFSVLGSVHITLAMAGAALFAVAAGGAVVYLFEERNLKSHRTGPFLRRGPALQTLDALNRRCILLGFPIFTLAMITGAVWLSRLADSGGLFTAQYAIATATWILYAILVLARVTAGWRGRKAALVTLGGFVMVMAVLLIYFVRGVTGT